MTAVVAARLLGVRLSGVEWSAVGVVCAGLGMLGLASGGEGHGTGSAALAWSMLGIALGILLIGAAAGRLPGGPGRSCWGSARAAASGWWRSRSG